MTLLTILASSPNLVMPSTIIGLLGLIAGYLYYYFRQKNKNELKKVESLSESDRLKYLEQKLSGIGTTIDSSNLSPEHNYNLLQNSMKTKTRIYLISAITLIAVSIVVAFMALGENAKDDPESEKHGFFLESEFPKVDQVLIDKLESAGYESNSSNAKFIIEILDLRGELADTNGSSTSINYYYNRHNVEIKIDKRLLLTLPISKTEFEPTAGKAMNRLIEVVSDTLNHNMDRIYNEIVKHIDE